MTEQPSSSPLSLNTKIPLYWLFSFAIIIGGAILNEAVARADFEAKTDSRIIRLEQSIDTISNEVKGTHEAVAKTCVEIAVMKNNDDHVIALLEDLKQQIKGIKDGM